MLSARAKIFVSLYAAVTIALFGGGVAMLALYTPTESTMGQIQKIFYLHLPVAINTFLACLVAFVASIGYLLQRKTVWDDLASSAAKVAVLFCSIVLVTGMVWGKGAWGQWWTWSPRLTFSLMLWLLYVVYLIVRNSIDSRQRRAVVSAVYAIIAFLDVPLVYLSARLMPDIHPSSISLEPAMQVTLAYWFLPVTLAAGGLIVLRFMLARAESEREMSPAAKPAEKRSEAIVPGSPVWEQLLARRSEKTTAEATHE